ncbi:O-antigen ligase family protein [Priestia aryabhattai]|uniref:O-antigen ligase family protein n=1 Tax=Priestia megaterium TaxID=1404 RepID=UPI0039B8E30A
MGVLIFLTIAILLWKNYFKTAVFFLIFTFVSIPYNYYIYNKLFINVLGVDMRVVSLCLIYSLFIVNIFKRKVKIEFSVRDLVFVSFILLASYYFLLGVSNNTGFIKDDTYPIIIMLLTYSLSRNMLSDSKDITKFLHVISLGTFVYSLCVIFIYLFMKDRLVDIFGETLFFWWGEERINFVNTTLILFSAIFSLDNILKKHKQILFSVIFIFNFIAMFLSQNRTLIASFMVILVLYLFYKLVTSKITNKKITLVAVIILIGLGVGQSQGVQDIIEKTSFINNVYNRFFEEKLDTLNVRQVTNNNGLEKIKEEPLGYGIGQGVALYTDQGAFYSEGTFIDNLFITLGIKIGIVGLSLFTFMIIDLFIIIIKILIKTKDKNYLLLLMIYPFFVLISAVMNAQMVYGLPVMMVFIILYAFCIKHYNLLKTKIRSQAHV